MLYKIMPRYEKNLKTEKTDIFSDDFWTKAVDFYDKKEHEESILNTLAYENAKSVDIKSIKKELIKSKEAKFSIVHDLVTLEFTLNNKFLEINVELVKVEEDTNIVALLRKITEVNSKNFKLSHLTFKDGLVFLKYKEPIELCKPIKLHWLLHEIAIESNKYLSLFCQKYQTSMAKEAEVKKLSLDELEKVKKNIKNILEDYDSYKKNFIDNQRESYVWDILQLSFLKIYNIPQVNGYLQHELINIIGFMYDGDYSSKYRIEQGVEFIEDLKSRDFSEIEANLHHPKKLIYMIYLFDKDNISEKISKHDDVVENYKKDDNYMGLSYFLTERLLNIVYDYDLSQDYKHEIENALFKSQKQEYKDASKILLESYKNIKNKTVKRKDGIFRKLLKTVIKAIFYIVVFLIIQAIVRSLNGK